MSRTISALTLVAAFATLTASAQTLLFDFGRTDTQIPFLNGWNNIVPATTDLFDTLDSNNNFTGIGLEITDPFFQTGEPSFLGSFNPSGDAGIYPVDATSDFFFGHNNAFAGADPNPLATVRLYNLDPAKQYAFSFFASRGPVNDLRETLYTVHGAATVSGVLEPANNETDVLKLSAVAPDGNGEIYVDFQSGPGNTNGNFYYVNIMQMDIIPEPSSLVLLSCSVLLMVCRRR